jgi:hypothetical protein
VDVDGQTLWSYLPPGAGVLARAGEIVTIEWLGQDSLPQIISNQITTPRRRWSIKLGMA